MKENSKIGKLILAVVVLMLIAAIVMLFAVGFNKSVTYSKGSKIEVEIPQGYNKQEVEEIAKEAFPNRELEVQDIEKLNQVFAVKLENYTDEELESFKAKIAEKYDIEKKELTVLEITTPSTRISTLVKPYLFPVGLATALSIVYIGVRNITNKQMGNKILKLILTLVLAMGVYFSIIMIGRIPVAPYTMPVALAVYVAALLCGVIYSNKE